MKKFYLGLDIGTDSVGIACADEEYRLLRAKGKDLWAVRLFDEAKSAEGRRIARSTRKRIARRQQRIDFLQEIFSEYIEDETFFIRLNNSAFCLEDKSAPLRDKYSLFGDGDFTDKEFYSRYPTIYHLRSALCKGGSHYDLRLYYLALHHIIKYRGHFLSEGSLEEVRNIRALFEHYNETVRNFYDDSALLLPVGQADAFKQLALDKLKTLSDKKRECCAIFHAEHKQLKEIISLISGGSANGKILFPENGGEELGTINFQGISDEEFDALQESYGDDFQILSDLRSIYNFTLFEKVLGGEERISDAMIVIYEKHRQDLMYLKKFVREHLGKDVYVTVFKSTKEGANYVNYIGYTKPKKQKINVKKCGLEDFSKFLKKVIEERQDTFSEAALLQKEYIFAGLSNGTFLPKIINADNGIFPHQVNEAELIAILDNLVKDYPDFLVPGEDGFSASEKIKKIFGYRIPYFVGSLNTYHQSENKGAWAVRKSGKITPWNFEQMVDLSQSNERFIRRMTGKCTYLYGKDVLPQASIYYQAFTVLNQLNKIKLNEEPLSVPLKQELFHNVFLKYKKVTDKRIKDYLVQSGKLTIEEARQLSISGKDDGAFTATMSSYITLKEILGDFVDTRIEIAEQLILWHTLNSDKKIVESLLEKKYGSERAIKENIKRLKGLTSFQKFGKLSKEFLTELSGGENQITKTAYTILGELYATNMNLNELLHCEKYRFSDAVQEYNGNADTRVTYEDLEQLYLPVQARRGIWQALKMTDEYVQAIGRVPDKIFVEVTRGPDKSQKNKRTVSRKKQILNLYKNLQDVEHLTDELNSESMTDLRLRSERLYLYFMQLGKCAYTGQIINLEQLNTDIYDVDHIVPRSLTKDDSLDNKVLVLREKNRQKSDKYPLEEGFSDQKSFWKRLYDHKLMSDQKYSLLMRTTPLTDDDFNGFMNRQIVITSQTVKAVAELLKRKYGQDGCKIVYSKASNVDDFKQKFSIVKCRETNDLHHARDAYLNIVVGNVYDTLFTCRRDYFYKSGDGWREYNLKKLFDREWKNTWRKERDLQTVLQTLNKFSIIVTEYSYIGKGALYNQTVCDKYDTGARVPRKNHAPYNIQNDDGTFKYGGYKSLNTAYFSVITSVRKKGKKQKTIKTIEAIPVYYDYLIKNGKMSLIDYFQQVEGLSDVQILVPELKTKSLVRVGGFPAVLTGISGSQILINNAVQWYTDRETDAYVNALLKYSDYRKAGAIGDDEMKNEEFTVHTNRLQNRKRVIDREHNIALYQKMIAQLERPVYSISGAESFRKNLIDGFAKFVDCSVDQQVTVLLQCVKFFKCNAELSDLSLLGKGAHAGKLSINKNISDVSFEIVHMSPCGLTKRIKTV